MHSLAVSQLQGLLGRSATEETTWNELRRFEAAAIPIIYRLWELQQLEEEENNWHRFWELVQPGYGEAAARYNQRRAAAVAELAASMGVVESGHGAATLYMHPQLWQPAYQQGHGYYSLERAYLALLADVARTCALSYPPADWPQRLASRMVALFTGSAVGERETPNLLECLGYLCAYARAHAGPPQLIALLDALATGDCLAAWQQLTALANQPAASGADQFRRSWLSSGSSMALVLLEHLHRAGRLDNGSFRRLLEALPGSLSTINHFIHQRLETESTDEDDDDVFDDDLDEPQPAAASTDELREALAPMLDAVLWEMLSDMRPETWPVLRQISYLSGGRYLLRLLEEVEWRELDSLHPRYGYDDIASVLTHMLGVLRWRDDDHHGKLVQLLRQFRPATLLASLPHASAYETELLAALDWPGSPALVALLKRVQQTEPARSTEPEAGVMIRQEVLDVVGSMQADHVAELMNGLSRHYKEAVTLVRAALGENRKEIRRLFGRRNQLAARALGLLPLEKPDELLQRYLLLTRYQREANSSGAGKKAYERAAALAGLANLAANAGFSDVTRMEWAMEDTIGAQGVAPGRQWQIEDYSLTLVLRGSTPAIEVSNGKRTLKRTPAAVTRDYAYREVKATLEQAQDQERRYRLAFLEAMRRGQPLSADELALLRRNPLAVALLETLVLVDEAGAIGLYRADDNTLEGSHGERVPVSGAVTIAHPYALVQLDVLANWQTELVRRQVVQPFKQVFRELYVITPAEEEAAYSSGRLAGRRLRGRQATAVLANLGWQIDGYGTVRKPFHQLGIVAHFAAGTGYGYYDDDDGDQATTGALEFWPLKQEYQRYGEERRVKLADIPPLVFSEVLRDLDAVTVIAHQGDEEGTSREVVQRRADLLRATAQALGLSQVQVAEPFVWVTGSRTRYRIHLATGAIYLENGRYLCIVPSQKERKAIYLPFEESGEPVMSEIISKMLLLADDRRISDPTILQQLPPARQAA
ncbi:MAG: DUF4132 domain-containing protein [Chloroflexaceae bacterium]|jgi:hypothetical protein|nr:DUF4132 domain-containing protein [Chloroflexaceae bacterium]